jgi:hypothetical protein
MARKKIPGGAVRSFMVDLKSYNAIQEFFSNSPAGITTSQACREVLRHFGEYCQARLDEGTVASYSHLSDSRDIISQLMGETEAK